MAKDDRLPSAQSTDQQVAEFLAKVKATPTPVRKDGARGRLIFALDATASREPTWDMACHIQAGMFEATAEIGGLDVQLVFYRGYGECKASRWVPDARTLQRTMTGVSCLGGRTQIGRVLTHARKQTQKDRVGALVFVGDAMEEDIDALCNTAGELGVLGLPCFMFHEGYDPIAARAFEHIAQLSGGACCPFNAASPETLRALLAAVAVFAAGGRMALEDHAKRHGGAARQLSQQLLLGRRQPGGAGS